jgi:hypothetical protein
MAIRWNKTPGLLSVLEHVLTNERDLPWWCNSYTCEKIGEQFTQANAALIIQCAKLWGHTTQIEDSDASFSFDSEVPGRVFLPAAKVIFTHLLDSHLSPQALERLRILSQIRALIEGTTSPPDTLDVSHIVHTAEWLADERRRPGTAR